MSELYMYLHGREICKSKYLGSINTVMLYILTLHRPVTIFDLRILRFRKLLSTSIFVCMHICKLGAKIATVTIKSQWSVFLIFIFYPLHYTLTCRRQFLPPPSLGKHAKINDSPVIQMGRMVCTQCTVKKSPQNPIVNIVFFIIISYFQKIRHFRYLTS